MAIVPGIPTASIESIEVTLGDQVAWDLTGGGAECQAKEPEHYSTGNDSPRSRISQRLRIRILHLNLGSIS